MKAHLQEMLAEQQQVHQVRVVIVCFLVLEPHFKVWYCSFRNLSEENVYCLTDKCHMLDFVPFVLKQGEERIWKEMFG